jgi:nicotinamidase-related amidase
MKNPKILNKDECLSIVIDVQERLIRFIQEGERVVKNILKLLKLAKILKIPIIFTQQKNLGEVLEEIKKEGGDSKVISKLEFNCFENKEFKEKISKMKRKKLILVGFESHICILETALGAPKSYKIFVVQNCISSRKLLDHNVAIERMRKNGIEVLTAEMVVFELLKKGGTHEFKKFLPLIKEYG